jgi:glycosyltransferase involved in cell wall biosynthesis
VTDDAGRAPLFSVITVCLNAAEHLAQAMSSVACQSYSDYEYVIVDGGSTDGTHDIIRALEPDFSGRLRWTAGPDVGLYDAMNKALALATGTYVVFLGADDRLAPGALGHVAAAVSGPQPPDMVCGAVHVFGPDGSWDELPVDHRREGRVPKRAPARHQSIFVNRDMILAAGGFDLRYRIAADYDLYLRLLATGASQVLIPQMLSEFRLGGVSSSNALATAREYRDVRIAHGAGRWFQEAVMWKSVAAAQVHAAGRKARSLLGQSDD